MGLIFNLTNLIFFLEQKTRDQSEVQKSSAIDSNSLPIPDDMPGYDDKVIMASGSFTQGSSIEMSCDGPLRSPYIAYYQGSLTYEYGKLMIMNVIENILSKEK